jgi:surfeit locus 1 family protein
MFRLIFSRRWWTTTLLVLVGIGLTIRLGIWQVDRYLGNKAFADHLSAMQGAAPLMLGAGPQPAGLTGMEYRVVQATGTFDFSHQVAVKNQIWVQTWGDETGYILVTPLVFPDGSAVLVDRGWIPLKYSLPASWREFDTPGSVTVTGVLRLPVVPGMGGEPDPTLTPGQTSLDLWNFVDLNRLQKQMPYQILPVYIEQAPVGDNANLPFRVLPDPDLSEEGINAGYATVWFVFTALLIFGYPLYLRKQTPGTSGRQQ